MFESSHLIFMPAVSPRIAEPSGGLVAMTSMSLLRLKKRGAATAARLAGQSTSGGALSA
jgi:hypothetical protein